MVKPKHPKNDSQSAQLNRRRFLETTAKTGAVLMAPAVIPSSVLGLNGAVPPSEKIVLAGLGIGGRGRSDLTAMLRQPDVHCVAICDAQRSRREKVKEIVDDHNDNTDCKMYPEMNEFLAERTDIDALLIATGDRWHALASILAMRAGKDVYSEKPSCMTVAEGQAVVETAARYGRVYQTGTQRLNQGNFVFANELLRTGRLGEVTTTRAHIAPWDAAEMRHDWLPEEKLPASEDADWDAWLGPCPWRPYNEKYVKGGWRGHYDFHTSCIGEWGAHTFAQAQVALGAGETSAISYGYVENKTGDGMVVKFANGIDMVLQLEGWKGSCGVRYEGSEGWVATADGYDRPDLSNTALLKEYDKIVSDYVERTQRPVDSKIGAQVNHVRDFFDCVKSRRQTVANPVVMHRTMSTVHGANICMWLKRDMKYDPVKEEFIDDPEANRLRSRAMREPYII